MVLSKSTSLSNLAMSFITRVADLSYKQPVLNVFGFLADIVPVAKNFAIKHKSRHGQYLNR